MSFSLKTFLSRNRTSSSAHYYPVVVPLGLAVLVGVAVVYLSMWFNPGARSVSFWPATGVFTWAFFAAAASIAFFRRERRVMTNEERSYFARFVCAIATSIILAGGLVLAIGYHLLGALAVGNTALSGGTTGPTLLGMAFALVIAVPASYGLAWCAVCAPLQDWVAAHFPAKRK